MSKSDVEDVVDVIESHDEDDADDARNDFLNNGFGTHWVAEIEGEITAISGYRQVPETYGSGWVSWTYVLENHCGKGIGKRLFKFVLEEAIEAGAQKLFIKVSNYTDEFGNNIYQTATSMYESFGFECEIVSKDFYDVGEDQLIYSKNLLPKLDGEIEVEKEKEKPAIRFADVYEIAETDGAYSFSWEVIDKSFFQKRSFSVDDLYVGLQAVKERGGRIVFLTFLSNLPLIHSPLASAGFKFVGQLEDYYEPGVHELHFVHRLDGK
jgi:GNAT superfamily N-acetyltransferase